MSCTARAAGFLIVSLALGCSPPVKTVGNSRDSATWLRAQGPNPEGGTIVGHAFVLSTLDDYCLAFDERFRIQREAWADRGSALADAGEDPQARCEAEKTWWESRLEAEQQLYFQEARHTSLYAGLYEEDEGGCPSVAGHLEEGPQPLDDAVIRVNTLRAHRLDLALDFGLVDCSDTLTQDLAERISGYRGPPREHWSASSGGTLEVVFESEDERSITVVDGEMAFVREIDYGLPSPGQPNPVIEDEEPREPVPLSFSRTFVRCDVDVDEGDWWHLLNWAWSGSP